MSSSYSKVTPFYQAFFEAQGQLALVLTCASGFEHLLLEEIKDILPACEATLEQGNGSVRLQANFVDAMRLCLWSRIAEQVLVHLLDIQVLEKTQQDARETFYQAVKSLPWHSLFALDKSFRIDSSGEQTVFDDERFATLVCKDAIADAFRFHFEKRPSVVREHADVHLQLFGEGNHLHVYLNIAGERLHKRGYRVETVDAPLRETLAAALLRQMQWQKVYAQAGCFLDPCCGSGTFLCEALLMAADSAPHILRMEGEGFAFEKLEVFGEVQRSAWQQLKQQAQHRKEKGLQQLEAQGLKFRGYDAQQSAIQASRKNLQALGLEKYVHLERRNFHQISEIKDEQGRAGVLIANPPYGERLQGSEDLKYLYRFLGERFTQCFAGWQVGIICSQVELLDALALKNFEQQRFYNGNLKCLFRQASIVKSETVADAQANYFLKALEQADEKQWEVPELKNRLLKNLKKLKPWLNKNQVNNFRVYDADLPEFNAAIDCYQNGKSVFMIVAEYAPPKTVDAEIASKRLNQLTHTLRQLFDLHREHIFIKRRERQKGKAQYMAKENKSGKLILAQEGGLNFLLNPVDYLDTGLFLDHRLMRERIRSEAKGRRFLNLFAYTGSVSVYAAAGGAKSTCSVDLSANYLEWASKNFLANGFSLEHHGFESADVMQWIEEDKQQYDLMFIDPPTFSNTKKKHLNFDVQSDHHALIEMAMRRLDPQGKCYFSTNFKKFELSPQLEVLFKVEEISKQTVSEDFLRRQPHRTWLIQKI